MPVPSGSGSNSDSDSDSDTNVDSDADSETAWEYETVRPPREATMEEAGDPEAVLNEYGREGWELVETIDYSGGGTKYLVFKRPARGSGGDDE